MGAEDGRQHGLQYFIAKVSPLGAQKNPYNLEALIMNIRGVRQKLGVSVADLEFLSCNTLRAWRLGHQRRKSYQPKEGLIRAWRVGRRRWASAWLTIFHS